MINVFTLIELVTVYKIAVMEATKESMLVAVSLFYNV